MPDSLVEHKLIEVGINNPMQTGRDNITKQATMKPVTPPNNIHPQS